MVVVSQPIDCGDRGYGFPLPLKAEDEEPLIDLQAIFQGIYERAGYGFRLNYLQLVPATLLSEVEQAWVDNLLKSRHQE